MKSFLIVSALLLFPLCIFAHDTDGFVGGGWLPTQFAPPGDIDEALPHYIVPKSVCVRYSGTVSGFDLNGLQSELIIKSLGGGIKYNLDPGDSIYQIVCNTRDYFKAIGIDAWVGKGNEGGVWLILNVPPACKTTETDSGLDQWRMDIKETEFKKGDILYLAKYFILIH